jgi:hypothetical protein
MVRRSPVMLILAAACGSVSISGQSAATDARLFNSNGIVSTFSNSTLTIAMKNGEMTFAIAPSTRFAGKGLASDLLWREPRTSNYVNIGDLVIVTYRPSSDSPMAERVRIVQHKGK